MHTCIIRILIRLSFTLILESFNDIIMVLLVVLQLACSKIMFVIFRVSMLIENILLRLTTTVPYAIDNSPFSVETFFARTFIDYLSMHGSWELSIP